MPILGLSASLVIASVFATSGAGKLRAGTFVGDLANYRVLPIRLVVPVARVLPWLEIAVGVAVLFYPTIALLFAAAMLTLFTAAVVANLVRGRHIRCGCRGNADLITWRLAAVNFSLIVVALTGAAVSPAPRASLVSAPAWVSSGDALAAFVSVAMVFVAVKLVQSWMTLVATLRRGPPNRIGRQT